MDNRKHFYVLAARIMRAALVDHYRQTHAQKRGGDLDRVALHADLLWVDATSEQVLDLDRALEELESLDSLQADLFGMRDLLGCTAEETATLAGLSKATVDKETQARARLFESRHHAEGRFGNLIALSLQWVLRQEGRSLLLTIT